MKNFQKIAWLPGLLLFSILTGCATYPISSSLRTAARKDITFNMVLNAPKNYIGSLVIWGGVIVQTTNLTNGSEIIVLETPLKGMERPEDASYSMGRFIAQGNQFLDPAIYNNGMRVTIAGEITGQETRPLGQTQYNFPILTIKEIYLWPKEKVYIYEPVNYWDYEPYWWPDEEFSEHRERNEHFERPEHIERHEGHR